MVLYIKDYLACRPTEVPEDDVYLFESKYIEAETVIRKIKSAKRYAPSFKVGGGSTYNDCNIGQFLMFCSIMAQYPKEIKILIVTNFSRHTYPSGVAW